MENPSRTAAELLLARRKASTSLVAWARYCGFEPAAHHRLLIEKLEAVSRGETDRLLICMPPGAAKSTYSSVLFPAWFLANHPDAAIIAASHTGELSERFGRRVRNLILEHGTTLGLALRRTVKLPAGGSSQAVVSTSLPVLGRPSLDSALTSS